MIARRGFTSHLGVYVSVCFKVRNSFIDKEVYLLCRWLVVIHQHLVNDLRREIPKLDYVFGGFELFLLTLHFASFFLILSYSLAWWRARPR